MDWMRCNKCYRAMSISTRSFSLTHCGHVYCSQCLGQMGSKCPECGTVNFELMTLEKPPKLERAVNYFAPIEEVLDITSKATTFQGDQMMIAVRGAQEIEKKYRALKTTSAKLMEQIQLLTADCKKLDEEVRKARRAREQQLARNVRANEQMTPKKLPQHYQDKRNRSSKRPSTSRRVTNNPNAPGFSAQCREAPRTLENPEIRGCRNISTIQTPKYSYNPSPANSSRGSGASHRFGMKTPDSGFTSLAANSAARVGGFLVPSVARVPKSAATAKKKTPTDVRLSVPILPNECRS